jgi:hypothetical protein
LPDLNQKAPDRIAVESKSDEFGATHWLLPTIDRTQKAFPNSSPVPNEVVLDELLEILDDSGLDHRGTFVPIDATVQGNSYFDPRGPLSKVWRDGDSIWSLVAEDRLNLTLSRIRKLDERGELETYVARNDAPRTHIGQVTVVFASRR